MPQPGQPGASFCFRVKQERPGWNVLNLVPAKTTVDLAALVCGAPEFLSMDGGEPSSQAAVVLSERGDARVVAAVDEIGRISLVGCPAQLTRVALTTVVQELLVFSGRLWRMPPEEFFAVLEKRLGGSLSDHFTCRAAIGWSENGFRSGLGRSLERGRFPVVLLLNGANPEVAEAVAHLKSHNIEVRSLGVELYESSGVEVIMPRVLEIAEPATHEDGEQAKSTPRSSPPQLRTPSRPQVSRSVSSPQTAESVSAKKMPWADEPAPKTAEAEAAHVEEAEAGNPTPDLPTESAAVQKTPWADEPARDAPETLSPPAKTKPLSSVPPPASKAAPAARPIWDGTMPGVMAGKRPPRRPGDGPSTHKGHEQATGRNT
jgi:hypothetical protein